MVVGEEGFEPPTLWSQTRCATKLRYSPTMFRLTRPRSLIKDNLNNGVANEARTRDNRNHNPGLYQLSYSHQCFLPLPIRPDDGAPERIRTFDLWLRRPTLYPAELRAPCPIDEVNITDQNATRQVFFFVFIPLADFISKSMLIRIIHSTTSALNIHHYCYTYQIATSAIRVNQHTLKQYFITFP